MAGNEINLINFWRRFGIRSSLWYLHTVISGRCRSALAPGCRDTFEILANGEWFVTEWQRARHGHWELPEKRNETEITAQKLGVRASRYCHLPALTMFSLRSSNFEFKTRLKTINVGDGMQRAATAGGGGGGDGDDNNNYNSSMSTSPFIAIIVKQLTRGKLLRSDELFSLPK